jgi:hypothetical protein
MKHAFTIAVIISALAVAVAGPLRAEDAPLEDVLQAVARYVAAYEPAFSLIVAEEEYVQRLRVAAGGPIHETRVLRSDVVFVRSPGAPLPWTLLRDVFAVDGAMVRDRQARLETLLVRASPDALVQARALADESTRYNLGRGVRNFNVPTLVLTFLHPSVQSRFTFARGKDVNIDGRTFAELSFQEVQRPTLIHRPPPGSDVPARGRVRIDLHEGTVAWTELQLETRDEGTESTTGLETTYRPMPALALWVPVEMRERWEVRVAGPRGRSGGVERVDGLATYRGFRRAQVKVDDEVHLPEVDPGR